MFKPASFLIISLALLNNGISSLAKGASYSDNVVNVKDLGAKGDGTTDDSKIISSAVSKAINQHSTVFFPKGTYIMNGTATIAGSVAIKGETGALIKTSAAASTLFYVNGNNIDSLVVSGMRFEGGETVNNFISVGAKSNLKYLSVKNCSFVAPRQNAILMYNVAKSDISNNVFYGYGHGIGTGMTIIDGCKNVAITNNKFYYLSNGVYVVGNGSDAKGNTTATYRANVGITFSNNYVDFSWTFLPAKYSGSGSNVSYTNNTITDPSAKFANITPYTTVRLLSPVVKGKIGGSAGSTLNDPNGKFVSAKLNEGDYIRSGNKISLVDSVISNTSIKIRGWYDARSLVLVPAPGVGDSYDISHTVLGRVKSFTATSLTVLRFHDVDGNTVSPAKDALYQVLYPVANHPFHVTKNNDKIVVKNNTLVGAWADQVSIYCDNSVITGNTIYDGQDMGITVYGNNSTITGNNIWHEGSGGIWITGANNVVKNNIITDMGWQNNVAKELAYINVVNGSNNDVSGNTFTRNKVQNVMPTSTIRGKSSGNRINSNNAMRLARGLELKQ